MLYIAASGIPGSTSRSKSLAHYIGMPLTKLQFTFSRSSNFTAISSL